MMPEILDAVSAVSAAMPEDQNWALQNAPLPTKEIINLVRVYRANEKILKMYAEDHK